MIVKQKRAPIPNGVGALCFLWACFILLAGQLGAAPPVKTEFSPGGRTCYLNETAASVHLERLSGGQAQGIPQPSTPHVLVIRVQFSDLSMTLSKTQTEGFFTKVQNFYSENSYGVFVPTFTITQSVHTLGSLATYGADCGSDVACKDILLRQAAVAAENSAGQDFSNFDQVMIYHAGNGQESSGQPNDIWSVYFPGIFSVDGQFFDGFTVVPEQEAGNVDPLGVICHEYGHQLGLPDLYDTSVPGGASTVGSWDVMDYPYTAASGQALGENPSHLGAWSKTFLGFINPQIINASGNYSFSSVNVSSSSFQMPIVVSDVGPSNEFFLIEYRNIQSSATYDKGIPGSGILIWHVDETIASSAIRINNNDVNSPSLSGKSHRGVDLVEADFTQNYSGGSKGEPGDAFNALDNFITPLSDAFNEIPTGIIAANFSGIETASAQFQVDIPVLSTFTLSSGVEFSTTVIFSNGQLTVFVPAGAFPNGTSFFVSGISSNSFSALGNGSFAGEFEPGLTGCLIAAQSQIQPVYPLPFTLDFSLNPALSTLASSDMKKLVIARYDASGQAWVPFSSTVDEQQKTVSASLFHLSLFQILKAAPGSSVSGVKIFPNPLRPNLGPSYQTMNFSNLPSFSKIEIFSLFGERVVELTSDNAGLAVWDGRNSSGHNAASGVYFALIKDGNGQEKEIKKVLIER